MKNTKTKYNDNCFKYIKFIGNTKINVDFYDKIISEFNVGMFKTEKRLYSSS